MLFGSQLVTVGNTDRLYYNGWDATHSPAIPYRHVHVGVASFTRGRFVGLRAPRFGKVTTRPFYIPRTGGSRTLHVNASLPAGMLHYSSSTRRPGGCSPAGKAG